MAHAHGHAGCGHTLVAGEAKRWSELHRQHRQLLDKQAEAGIVLQEQPVPAAAAAPEDVDSFADSSSSFASSNTSARPVPRMLAASSGTVPIRVWVEYQGISSLSEDGKQRLYDTVNIALGVLQKFFKVCLVWCVQCARRAVGLRVGSTPRGEWHPQRTVATCRCAMQQKG